MSTFGAVLFRSGTSTGGWSEKDSPEDAERRQRGAYAMEDRLLATRSKIANLEEELRNLKKHEDALFTALQQWHNDRRPFAKVARYKGL